eukprot:7348834-Alexandrium_andersonii.AAC.1
MFGPRDDRPQLQRQGHKRGDRRAVRSLLQSAEQHASCARAGGIQMRPKAPPVSLDRQAWAALAHGAPGNVPQHLDGEG